MRWASQLSTRPDARAAIDEAVSGLCERLGGTPDVALLFTSIHHGADATLLATRAWSALAPEALVGCSGGGILANGLEREQGPALALMGGRLSGGRAAAVHLSETLVQHLDEARWQELVGSSADEQPSFVLLADPYSFSPEPALTSLDAAFPHAVTVGGLASGGRRPGSHALFVNDVVQHRGAVLLRLHGDVVIDPLIAQGCRPVGEALAITSCDGNVITGLNGRSPKAALTALVETLSDADRQLMRQALFIGIEMRDQRLYQQGDFLIRNIMGLSDDGGALAVAARLRRYQAIQFHLRDAAASADDLRAHLERYAASGREPAAALMFSCLGRGSGLYGEPHHDSRCVRDRFEGLPLAGFFCNGELGPVAGRSYVHGYTSALGMLRRRGAQPSAVHGSPRPDADTAASASKADTQAGPAAQAGTEWELTADDHGGDDV